MKEPELEGRTPWGQPLSQWDEAGAAEGGLAQRRGVAWQEYAQAPQEGSHLLQIP